MALFFTIAPLKFRCEASLSRSTGRAESTSDMTELVLGDCSADVLHRTYARSYESEA